MTTPQRRSTDRTIEIQTVNARNEFRDNDHKTAYVEVVLKVSILESDLFEPFHVVEDRAKQFIAEKLK